MYQAHIGLMLQNIYLRLQFCWHKQIIRIQEGNILPFGFVDAHIARH